jgi:hemerythrin-like metal-binding protein
VTQHLIDWNPAYSIGLEEIDEQHKVLFDIINAMWDEVIKREKGAALLDTLDELERYTVTHFTAEETFMRSHGYSKFDAHKQQHDRFIERVRNERLSIEAGGPVSLDMINFLKDWLINHILVQDKEYAVEFQSKRLGGLSSFFSRLLRL